MTRLVIDRNIWLRGDASALLNDEGKSCVLGFLGRDCGYTDDDLRNEGEPGEMASALEHNLWPAWVVDTDSEYWDAGLARWDTSRTAEQVIDANDDPSMSDDHRERRLAELFASNGIELVFQEGPAA